MRGGEGCHVPGFGGRKEICYLKHGNEEYLKWFKLALRNRRLVLAKRLRRTKAELFVSKLLHHVLVL